MNGLPTVQVLTSVFNAFPSSRPSGPERRQRDDDRLANVGQLFGRGRLPRLPFEQRAHGLRTDIMDKEFVPGVEQLARHRLTHLADAEVADAHCGTPGGSSAV
jgi:hypothetical protein